MQVRIGLWYLRHHAAGDVSRIVRWGLRAPRYAQLTYVDPAECDRLYEGWHRRHSALVADGNWDLEATLFENDPKMVACRQHFEMGKPWEETGIYEYILGQIEKRGGRYDGCSTIDDVVNRYRRLDVIYDQIRKDGRLRSSGEFGWRFRETGGVVIHFDRNARPIASGRGAHRLAIARILHLRSLPAMLGVVHRASMRNVDRMQFRL